MALTDALVRPDGLKQTPEETTLDVHLPWYRSLPLSCLEEVQVTLDGVACEDLKVRYAGQEYAVADLADAVDLWWFCQDPLTLVLRPQTHLARGASEEAEAVRVDLTLAVRIPYILIGPNMALVRRVTQTHALRPNVVDATSEVRAS